MFRSIASRLSSSAPAAAVAAAAVSSSTTTAAAENAPKGVSLRGARYKNATTMLRVPSKMNPLAHSTPRTGSKKTSSAVDVPLPEGAAAIKDNVMKAFIGGNTSAAAAASSSSSAAATSANNKFAVVMVNNIQYKVSPGDVIAVQRLAAATGSRIALKKVLMVGGVRFTAIGRPMLANCRVVAEVEEHKRFKGILNYTHYKGRHHTRLDYAEHATTMLRIVEVSYDPEIVGEVDRSTGILLQPSATAAPTEASPSCYYTDELPAVEKAAAAGKKSGKQ